MRQHEVVSCNFTLLHVVPPQPSAKDGPDLASNLICNGWAGVLVEGAAECSMLQCNQSGVRSEVCRGRNWETFDDAGC